VEARPSGRACSDPQPLISARPPRDRWHADRDDPGAVPRFPAHSRESIPHRRLDRGYDLRELAIS